MKRFSIFLVFLFSIFITTKIFGQNEDFENAIINPGPQLGGIVNGWSLAQSTGPDFCNPTATNAAIVYTVYNSPVVDPIMLFPNNTVSSYFSSTSTIQPSGNCFIRLNDQNGGGKVIKLTKTYTLTTNTCLFSYAYRAVISNPIGHACCFQPGVRILVTITNTITNTPTLLTCPNISVAATNGCGTVSPGFLVGGNINGGPGSYNASWMAYSMDLSPYIGNQVNIDFYTMDCAAYGHAGYVYLDALCGPMNLVADGIPVSIINPTATVNSCGANTLTIIAPIGLGPYSWLGPNTSTIQNTPSFLNQTFTTATSGNYTLTMNPLGSCAPITKTITISITPAASINISGPNTICSGNSATLNASGAITYTWSNNANTNTLLVSPGISTNYSVTGTNSNNCTASANITVSVTTTPTLIVTGPTSVCIGSSATYTLSGANSYSWNGSTVANTVNVLPNVNTSYTAVGTNNICTNTQIINLNVNSNCANVWPGDANSDGVANNLDLLELGLHISQTGAARPITGNIWQSDFSNNWIGLITNGKNVCHSDCNGDGIINQNDTTAILLNYNLTHAFKYQNNSVIDPQLFVQADQNFVANGQWGSASIFLGELNNPIDLNGIAFTLNFDKTFIQVDSISLIYPISFLNTNNDNIHLNKREYTNGIIYSASTHTNNINVIGSGKIASFHFKVSQSLLHDTIIKLELLNAFKSNSSGSLLPLTTGTTNVFIKAIDVGLREISASQVINIYPNPTKRFAIIESREELQKIEIFSVDGKILISETGKSFSYTLNLGSFIDGVYFIKVYPQKHKPIIQKIILNSN